MVDRPSAQRIDNVRIATGVTFLSAIGLAFLVKISRLGTGGVILDSVLWNALPSYCFVFGICLLGILYNPKIEQRSYVKLCIAVTAGALFYEIEQIWLEDHTFDLYDLGAIVLGSISAWFVYGMISSTVERSGNEIGQT